jgi:hypothetical protein
MREARSMTNTRCGFAVALGLCSMGGLARAQHADEPRQSGMRQADDEDRPRVQRRRAEGGDYLPGQRRRGFAFYGAFGTAINFLSVATTPQPVAVPKGELFLGYKLSRVVFGLSVDFTTATASGRTTASMLFSPEVQIAMARSGDGRVEMLGVIRAGAGTVITGQGTPPLVLGYEVAPGVRYWAHPQFAASVLAGVAGTHVLSMERFSSDHVAAVGVFVALGGLGVF